MLLCNINNKNMLLFIGVLFSITINVINGVSVSGSELEPQKYHRYGDGNGIIINSGSAVVRKTGDSTELDDDNDSDNSADDIRCYCNLPKCVTSGYMCRIARSTAGGCFSEVKSNNEKSDTRHGCIDLLPNVDNQRTKCDNLPRKHKNPNYESMLLCCQTDLCNHPEHYRKLKPNLTADHFDDRSINHPSSRLNNNNHQNSNNNNNLEKQKLLPITSLSGINQQNIPHHLHHQYEIPLMPSLSSSALNNNNNNGLNDRNLGDYNNINSNPNNNSNNRGEMWFRAATIAVPILGAIILFVLIAIAIRILKNDSLDTPSKLVGGGGGGGGGGGNRKIPLDYESYVSSGGNGVSVGNMNQHHQHNQLHSNSAQIQQLKHQSSSSSSSASPPLLIKQNYTPTTTSCYYHHHYQSPSSINHDLKNETQAKKNQLQTLEYSLLPQSCMEPIIKPTNTEAGLDDGSTVLLIGNTSSGGSSVGGGGGGGGSGSGGISGVSIGNSTIGDCGQLGNNGGLPNMYRNVNLSLNSSTRCNGVSDTKIYDKEVLKSTPYWRPPTNPNRL